MTKEERRIRTEDLPRALMYEQAAAATFVASPYHRPIIGWMNDLDAMTPQDLHDFYQHWYVPGNAALVAAGDVEVADVKRLAEKYYGHVVARPVPSRKPRIEPEQEGLSQIKFNAPASQAYVTLPFKAPQLRAVDLGAGGVMDMAPSHEALALTVLSVVPDGYSDARLERALVQGQGGVPGKPAVRVAHSAGASSSLAGRGPQLFALDGVPAEGKSTQQVAVALREQVALVAKDGVSAAELNRVKVQWAASETYKLDSMFNQANELGSNGVHGMPLDTSTRVIAALRTITSAEVQGVAVKYFGDDQLTQATLLPQPIDPNRKPRAAALGARL